MFSKRNLVDVKKSTTKIQDPKKDLATRIKHLKIILDNVDVSEAKGLFEANFSHVYNILYDSFIQAETNLRQRVHKAHKEELECTLWILDQVLCLLPELIHKRWQLHSMGRILSKLLHPGNSIKLRRQAIRFFLMWYQALNENAPEYVHGMFAALVPGFGSPSLTLPIQTPVGGNNNTSGSVFHDTTAQHPVIPSEILPVLPPSGGEKAPEHPSKFFLEAVLEHMVNSVVKLEWHDKAAYHHRCFHFLLERFKTFYLLKIFPGFSYETSLYQPNLDLPVVRKPDAESELMFCRVSLILWVASYMHQTKKNNLGSEAGGTGGGGGGGVPQSNSLTGTGSESHDSDSQHESAHPSLDSTISLQLNKSANDEELASQIVRDVLCSSRDNINFVHEIYRQALLSNFSHVIAIRKIIAVYKDLIQLNVPEIPCYMLEPPDDPPRVPTIGGAEELTMTENMMRPPPRLRNDSYLGAIHKENLLVRAGMQNVLQLFMTHAANVFLLEVNPHIPKMLEEQTDACKRVLNIYRYMVMNTRMDSSTWEQLLLVLLQITSLVLGENPPKKKMQTLGGKLAPAIFQTLIVTWIKANLNVLISRELWDRFLHVLTSLTNWEELIKEWAKTMETLTRVLARHVYNLDLTDLPLDRLNEKLKRGGGGAAAAAGGGGGGRRITSLNVGGGRPESTLMSMMQQQSNNITGGDANSLTGFRQDSSSSSTVTDGNAVMSMMMMMGKKRGGSCRSGSGGGGGGSNGTSGGGGSLSRSYSETSLVVKRRTSHRSKNPKNRRSLSLDTIPQLDTESTDRTRSPSPAPSSGLETNSIKDSPIQLDVLSSDHPTSDQGGDEHRGVICGGTIRGWLPDVAVILWRRMLGALGDVNSITEPHLHAQVFEYLVKLTETLIKIQQNQGITADNLTTPQAPELIPPLTLILPWCFGALVLPQEEYEPGKLNALRLLCTVTLNCDHKHRLEYLPQFYRFLHTALTGTSRPFLNTTLKYLGPRFLSLQLPGSSLLLLDLVHACNTVLNTNDDLESSPRTEAISIIANLLSLPDNLNSISVLQPEQSIHVVTCPDMKEHVVSILLRAGRREPKGKARCIALSALGMFVYKELTSRTFHPKVADAINVLLLALKFNNKIIAQLASNILFLLCDHASLLWSQYPRLGPAVVRTLCTALFLHAPLGLTANETDKALGTALLLCLGEWCMRLEPKRLMLLTEVNEYNLAATGQPPDRPHQQLGSCLLLQVFTVLYKIANGKASIDNPGGMTQPSLSEDFDPNILSDDLNNNNSKSSPTLSPSKNNQNQGGSSRSEHHQQAIQLCAKSVLTHLVSHLGHFPMAIGAARLSSLVCEHDDVPNLSSDELSASIFSAPNIQLFMLTQNVIASLIELPALDLPGGGVTAGLSTAETQVRVLLRDLSGKACWDAAILYRTPDDHHPDRLDRNDILKGTTTGQHPDGNEDNDEESSSMKNIGYRSISKSELVQSSKLPSNSYKWSPPHGFVQPESFMIPPANLNNLPQRAMRHRSPGVLPEVGNAAPDLDQLDDLLQYLGHTSPECLENFDRKLNQPANAPLSQDLEQEAIATVINQKNMEVEESRMTQHLEAMLGQPVSRPRSRIGGELGGTGPSSGGGGGSMGYESAHSNVAQFATALVEQSAFQQCRLLFSQLGLAGWERRRQLHLLNKTERLLRELRNLDGQRCRETHKVAVIYVAPGQEDKNSVLSNQGGSAPYEEFLAALAWEVELEGHTGFLGGLHRQGSTGLTAPYVATSFSEAIFHVATRMPGDTPETVLNKTRHLGNDEVHIVWSEHCRDYRRDIIPTEFCDILIVIYPLGNNLNRVTVNCKPDVPNFGILFHEAIVESSILAGLVRATAICASRAKRTTLSFYQQYYEERAQSLDTVVGKHKNTTTYEDFIGRVYSPVSTASPFCSGSVSGPHSGGGGGAAGDNGQSCAANPSMLAAALLDSQHGHSHKASHHHNYHHQRSAGDSKYNRVSASDARGVWFHNHTSSDISQNVESTSISPRPLKKISSHLKNVPRRSLNTNNNNNNNNYNNSSSSSGNNKEAESPPDSPQPFLRRK